MVNSKEVLEKSDSLIDLLGAQCGDLEKLLALARRETIAVREENFEDVLSIVSERSAVCARLETFQRQISELRGHLGAAGGETLRGKIIEVANLTLMQDRETKFLLTAARDKFAGEISNLEKSQRSTNAYLRGQKTGLAYDRNF